MTKPSSTTLKGSLNRLTNFTRTIFGAFTNTLMSKILIYPPVGLLTLDISGLSSSISIPTRDCEQKEIRQALLNAQGEMFSYINVQSTMLDSVRLHSFRLLILRND